MPLTVVIDFQLAQPVGCATENDDKRAAAGSDFLNIMRIYRIAGGADGTDIIRPKLV